MTNIRIMKGFMINFQKETLAGVLLKFCPKEFRKNLLGNNQDIKQANCHDSNHLQDRQQEINAQKLKDKKLHITKQKINQENYRASSPK